MAGLDTDVTVADAGPSLKVCSARVTLAGNAPLRGIGAWTTPNGASATVVNPSDPFTIVERLPDGITTFMWTIRKGLKESSATVTMTRVSPPSVSAGADRDSKNDTDDVNGTLPDGVTNGSCYVLSGSGYATGCKVQGSGPMIVQWPSCGELTSTVAIRFPLPTTPCNA